MHVILLDDSMVQQQEDRNSSYNESLTNTPYATSKLEKVKQTNSLSKNSTGKTI